MFETKLALNLGGYEHNGTSSRTDEDLNLWNKMKYAGATISHINQGLLYYRRHAHNFNKY
jgi:hypothetical protein